MNAAYQQRQTSGNRWAPGVHMLRGEHPQIQQSAILESGRGLAVLDDLEGQMATFAKQQAEIAELRKHFVLFSSSAVEKYLSEHRTLAQILLESVPHLRAHFGADAILNLRALMDESGSQTLYAVVMWSASLQDVRCHMAGFDDGWWLAHSRQTSGYLNFTYELV
jgi:hypothetical protein